MLNYIFILLIIINKYWGYLNNKCYIISFLFHPSYPDCLISFSLSHLFSSILSWIFHFICFILINLFSFKKYHNRYILDALKKLVYVSSSYSYSCFIYLILSLIPLYLLSINWIVDLIRFYNGIINTNIQKIVI